MFENIINLFKKLGKKDGQTEKENKKNKDAAKERLHLVLMQDRANVSADFLDMMRREIIEVIKKYIDVEDNEIDVRLTNKQNGDGTTGAPALYANIPIKSIKNETKKNTNKNKKTEIKEKNSETKKEDNSDNKNNQENNVKSDKKTEDKSTVHKKEVTDKEESKKAENNKADVEIKKEKKPEDSQKNEEKIKAKEEKNKQDTKNFDKKK